jgi:hypothetical protein
MVASARRNLQKPKSSVNKGENVLHNIERSLKKSKISKPEEKSIAKDLNSLLKSNKITKREHSSYMEKLKDKTTNGKSESTNKVFFPSGSVSGHKIQARRKSEEVEKAKKEKIKVKPEEEKGGLLSSLFNNSSTIRLSLFVLVALSLLYFVTKSSAGNLTNSPFLIFFVVVLLFAFGKGGKDSDFYSTFFGDNSQ